MSDEKEPSPPWELLFEDDSILVANKLSPLPVQADKTGDEDLQNILARRGAHGKDSSGFLEAVHRIDRPASGAILFAKSPATLAKLSEAFRERKIVKRYIAIVCAQPPKESGRLDQQLAWDKRKNKSWCVEKGQEKQPGKEKINYQSAVLEYKLIASSERYWILEVLLETGRHHQIRAQLASIGCPIKGDVKYGARRSNKSGLIGLHARSLEFAHPKSGEALRFLAPYPCDEPIWALVQD